MAHQPLTPLSTRAQPNAELALLPQDDLAALTEFLEMNVAEVEELARRLLRPSPTGTTWFGLANFMRRQGYTVVRELGFDAALSWSRHLGLVRQTSGRTARDVPRRGAA